jgi:hypothetical protein
LKLGDKVSKKSEKVDLEGKFFCWQGGKYKGDLTKNGGGEGGRSAKKCQGGINEIAMGKMFFYSEKNCYNCIVKPNQISDGQKQNRRNLVQVRGTASAEVH